MCFQFRFKCRYSDVEVISDGARKGIPDDWCCNVEAPTTELSSGPWYNHVSEWKFDQIRDVLDLHLNLN